MNTSRLTGVLVHLSGFLTILLMYVFSNSADYILLSEIILGIVMLIAIQSRKYALWYVAAFLIMPMILDIPGTHLGLWSFGTSDFLGFPFWLPFFYGNLTVSFLYLVSTRFKI